MPEKPHEAFCFRDILACVPKRGWQTTLFLSVGARLGLASPRCRSLIKVKGEGLTETMCRPQPIELGSPM